MKTQGVCVMSNFVPVTPGKAYFVLWNFGADNDCVHPDICCFLFATIHYFLRTPSWLY